MCRESTVSTGRVSVPIRIKPVDKTTCKKSADLGNIQRDLKVFIVTDVYSGSRPSKMYSLVSATCQAKVGSPWEKKKMLVGTLRFFWNQFSTSNQVTSGSTLGLSQQPRWRHKQSEKRREERFQHSWSSNFLLIENAKLLLQKCVCVCVCILRGMGALQIHGVWGRELVPLSPCPPSWVFC